MKVYNGNVSGSLKVTLQRAILIYTSEDRNADSYAGMGSAQALATVHEVEDGQLGPGVLASTKAIRVLATDLMGRAGAQFIPPHLLALGFNCMAWYCKPQARRLWFQPAEKHESAELVKLSGDLFPQPPLLFIAAHHTLRVFALATTARPNARTALYHAPYWNVNSFGTLCAGSTRLPDELVPENTAAFEEGFYKSRFTHPSAQGRTSVTPHSALWIKLVNRKRFPLAELVRCQKLTIAQALAKHDP